MKKKLFVLFLAMWAGIAGSYACTIFRLKAADGSMIVTRSMEFGIDLHYDLIVVPRNRHYTSPFLHGTNGMQWNTRYGYVGVASMGLDFGVSDGMNEKGLALGLLWYESDMQWQPVTAADSSHALASAMFSDWILGNFTTVDELRTALAGVKVFNYTDTARLKGSLTVHYAVYDAAGGCIVIEFDHGVCNIYDDPLGIMTNSPSFPWQMNNLRQYLGMNNGTPATYSAPQFDLRPTGHGEGMIGLPGDYTPPSRFVRLGVFLRYVDQQPEAWSNLNLSQHVINTFTIPFGMIVDKGPDGKIQASESTQWVTFRDLTNRILYFKTYDNPTLRKIDFSKLDFTGTEIRRIPMYGTKETIVEVTK
jgi:choloylglycine hydrolase